MTDIKLAKQVVELAFIKIPRLDLVIEAIKKGECLLNGAISVEEKC